MQAIDDPSSTFHINLQNEYIVAYENEKLVCIVPDLIATLDRESAEPITGEKLKYGQRLKIIGLSAASIMRRPECLKVFGPSAFGIEEEFVPLEKLPS